MVMPHLTRTYLLERGALRVATLSARLGPAEEGRWGGEVGRGVGEGRWGGGEGRGWDGRTNSHNQLVLARVRNRFRLSREPVVPRHSKKNGVIRV